MSSNFRATIARVSCALLMTAALLPAAGCKTLSNPSLKESAMLVPQERREHVYAIFLNSQNDPLGFTSYRTLYKFAVDCGFTNARYHHFNGGSELAAEVRAILKQDPAAKFCLIGWSGASLYAFDATKMVAPEITIDEIIYLDSNWIKEQRLNTLPHPRNVGRVAMLYSLNRTAPEGVPNSVAFKIPVEEHTDVASHPRTGDIIVNELIQLANRPAANRK